MAYAFLLPPTAEHWQVARTEFLASLRMSVTEIPDWLVSTTAYFFNHQDGCLLRRSSSPFAAIPPRR